MKKNKVMKHRKYLVFNPINKQQLELLENVILLEIDFTAPPISAQGSFLAFACEDILVVYNKLHLLLARQIF